jgi:hypothetical protein
MPIANAPSPYDQRLSRMQQLASLLEKLSQDLVRSQSVSPPGTERTSAVAPALWRLHQVTRTYKGAQTASERQAGLAEANAILFPFSFVLDDSEFEALIALFHTSSLSALAPYHPTGMTGPQALLW